MKFEEAHNLEKNCMSQQLFGRSTKSWLGHAKYRKLYTEYWDQRLLVRLLYQV